MMEAAKKQLMLRTVSCQSSFDALKGEKLMLDLSLVKTLKVATAQTKVARAKTTRVEQWVRLRL